MKKIFLILICSSFFAFGYSQQNELKSMGAQKNINQKSEVNSLPEEKISPETQKELKKSSTSVTEKRELEFQQKELERRKEEPKLEKSSSEKID